MNKKRIFFSILSIALVTTLCIPFAACGKKNDEKTKMIRKTDTIVKVVITDNRYTGKNQKQVTIEDEATINILVDTFGAISGTKMEYKYFGNFPNQTYGPAFPEPLFRLELTANDGEGNYKYTIFGGQKVPVYTNGYEGGVPSSYDYDYKYVCKNNDKTGHYENKTDGPGLEYYLQFFD